MHNFLINKNKLGFTMIELLVATGIVMIMAVASIPVLNRYTKKSAIDQTTQKLEGALGLIQSKALSGVAYIDPTSSVAKPAYWGFACSGTNQYWLGHSLDDAPKDSIPDGFGNDLNATLPALTNFTGCSGVSRPIYFERFTGKLVDYSGAYLPSATVRIVHAQDAAISRTIQISSGGKIETN